MNTDADRVWRRGPPPHVGWWQASQVRNEDVWRWWNGVNWSIGVHPGRSAEEAARSASIPEVRSTAPILYTTYWPENARVPRIDPNAAARHVRDQVLASVDIRTADGVAVAPGDRVWVNGSTGVQQTTVQPLVAVTGYEYFGPVPVSQSFSTEAAARAAQYKR